MYQGTSSIFGLYTNFHHQKPLVSWYHYHQPPQPVAIFFAGSFKKESFLITFIKIILLFL